jgi:cell division septation protein DedD
VDSIFREWLEITLNVFLSALGFFSQKEWDIELRIYSKFRVMLIGVLWIIAGAPEVQAFSVGGFQVQSKFGEKFKASLDINLDFDGPVEANIGSLEDYTKLGLNRQDIIDALIIDPMESGNSLRKTVRIRSNNPLFFPSFNLVIRATHNGGTLLENFLVTVDFQQSLALNVQRNKKTASKFPVSESKPEPLADQKVSENKSPKDSTVAKQPESTSRIAAPNAPNEKSKNSAKGSSQQADNIPPKGIDPVPAKEQVVHRRRASGVIWAHPRPVPESTTATLVQVQKIPAEKHILRNGKHVLQKGESLFSIARKLKLDKYHPAQIAVAIWMRNIDRFIFGNINGIREGVQLDVENLERTLAKIDLGTVRRILKSQNVEWDLAKNTTQVKEESTEKSVPEVPLPSERLEDYADLFDRVIGWQTTWENMDIEGHLAYYNDLKTENPFLVRKKRFLSRHPKPHLETSSKVLVMKEGIPIVFFEQKFTSETLKSLGLKELEWTRSQSVWKINGEKFHQNFSLSEKAPLANQKGLPTPEDEEKTTKLSFVIHVSSHANESVAVSLSNRLRTNGFDAYWVPVRISKEIQIYRVYVGRFSDWNQAHRVVRILRKKSFGGHATAIPYPLALQVGEASSLAEARMLLESLRKSGISGLLLVSHKESVGILFRVVVGAYKKAGNATWMLQQLKQSGFVSKLISP